MANQPSLLKDFALAAIEKRTKQGIIAFTHQGQLLYMNREAVELCDEMNQSCLGHVVKGVLPNEVMSLCRNIAGLLLEVTGAKDWENRHIRSVCELKTNLVLLRGFAIPRPVGIDHARIIIMLDRIVSRVPVPIAQAFELFHLTARSQAVVKSLSQ